MKLALDPITGAPGVESAGFQQFVLDDDAPAGDQLFCIVYGKTRAVVQARTDLILGRVFHGTLTYKAPVKP